jgi:uncharacterized protein (TIGR02118 family)
MIKISVMYPNAEGARFDMEYYCNTHIPMVKKLVGDAIKGSSVEQGISGEAPGSPATYMAIGSLYLDSLDDFLKYFAPHAPAFQADVPNFTNVIPTLQMSEVVL